jgi:hypothetical protein
MFCVYCGTQIPDDAAFCSKCGKPQKDHQSARPAQPVSSTDWEYWTWEAGVSSGMYMPSIKGKYGDRAHYGDQTNRPNNPEPFARLQFWQQIQSRVLPVIQLLRDDGWEPITEVGPASPVLDDKESSFLKGLVSDLLDPGSWKLYGLSIKFRRRKESGKYSVSELPNLIKRAGY